MKTGLASLMTAAAMLASSAVTAGTTIDTAGFSLAWTDSSSSDNFDMTLLSDANGTVRIGLEAGMSGISFDTSLLGRDGSFFDYSHHRLAGLVKEGYRIDSITFSAAVTGDMWVESPPPCDTCETSLTGWARNGASTFMSLYYGDEFSWLPVAAAENLDGSQTIQTTAAVPLRGEFSLWMESTSLVEAVRTHRFFHGDGDTEEQYFDALAAIDIDDMVLTVQVSAVPEPSSLAMLLAGLGVAGWAARRRRA